MPMTAKFRGVEFYVNKYRYFRPTKEAEADFLAEDSKSQDIKFENLNFKIEGYIYGENVESTKIRLEQAIEKKEGLLVLPDGREARVKCSKESCAIEKDAKSDDYYTLDFNFEKRDSDSLSLKIIELKEVDEEKLNAAKEAAELSFLENFNKNFVFEGFPNFVKIQSLEVLSSMADKISKLTADNLIGDLVNPLEENFDILNSVYGGVANAILSYLDIKSKFKDRLNGIIPREDRQYYNTYIDIATLDLEAAPPVSPDEASQQVYKNTLAVEELANQQGLIQAFDEAVNSKEYANREEVTQTVNELLETTLEVCYKTDSAEIQNNIENLLNISVALINKKHVVQTEKIQNNAMLPACVIAYDHYGSADFENKLNNMIKRNQIRHSLFVPGGTELEVESV